MQGRMTDARVNLLGLTRPELEAGASSAAARRFARASCSSGCTSAARRDFDAMTDLAKDFRAAARRSWPRSACPKIVTRQDAADGTVKWLLHGPARRGQGFEMVYIPEEDRGTLCISSQVGCALDCSFCSTAQQGFNRNLTTAEIVGQVLLAQRELGFQAGDERLISNVVLMGMGEPLANFRNVVPAHAHPARRAGLRFLAPPRHAVHQRPGAADLQAGRGEQRARWRCRCTRRTTSCAASWCRSTASTTSPSCSRPAGTTSTKQNGRSVTFEYVMLEGVNDSPAQARALARLLKGHPAKVNLIPFNPFPGTQYRRSSPEAIKAFLRPGAQGRSDGDDPQDPRRRHRCGLRPARRPRDRPRHASRMGSKRIAVPVAVQS